MYEKIDFTSEIPLTHQVLLFIYYFIIYLFIYFSKATLTRLVGNTGFRNNNIRDHH